MSIVSNIRNESNPVIVERFQSTKFWTEVKIQRVVLGIFAAIALSEATCILYKGVMGCVAWPIMGVALLLVAAAVGAVYIAYAVHDYENARELKKIKENALSMPLDRMVEEHGLGNIQKYQIVSKAVLQQKFREAYPSIKLSNYYPRKPTKTPGVYEKYSLKTIRKYDLVPLQELRDQFLNEILRMPVREFTHQFFFTDLAEHRIITKLELEVFSNLGECVKMAETDLVYAKGLIDQNYPNRQERLLKRLEKQVGEHKQWASDQLKKLEDWMKSIQAREDRVSLSNLVQDQKKGVREALDKILMDIEAKKQNILKEKIGIADQEAYNQKMQNAEMQFQRAIEKLDTQFSSFKEAY